MANPEHVEVVKRGAEAIRKWRKENPDTQPELGEADLGGADLGGANLHGADLGGVRGAEHAYHLEMVRFISARMARVQTLGMMPPTLRPATALGPSAY
jgi:hypothetical protein